MHKLKFTLVRKPLHTQSESDLMLVSACHFCVALYFQRIYTVCVLLKVLRNFSLSEIEKMQMVKGPSPPAAYYVETKNSRGYSNAYLVTFICTQEIMGLD